MVPIPTGQDVADFLGGGDDTALVSLAGEHVATIAAMARSYTRDNGFDDAGNTEEDVAAAITTATARLVSNPEQVRRGVGAMQVYNGFSGWSLAETLVLNRYRKKAR